MQANSILQNKPQFLDKETWHQHFIACKTGGYSKANYCEQYNLVYHQFVYWFRKFEEESALPIKDGHSQFVSVKIKSDTSLSKILCTLEFNDGKRLLIHDITVVETLMNRA